MGLFSFIVRASADYRQLEEQYRALVQRTAHILDAEASAREVKALLDSLNDQYRTADSRHRELVSKIAAAAKDEDLIEAGIYKPAYSFEFSTEYQLKLDSVRDLQKQMVKDKSAVLVGGTEPKTKTNRLVKLTLRAFNGECDALASKVSWKNINQTLDKVGKAAQTINKLVDDHNIEICKDYINLKLNEMQLIHEYQEKKQAEMEEQRVAREELREEQKARREYEKAQKEAAQELARYEKALAEAEADLAKAHGAQLDKLTETVELLKQRLEEAREKGLRAKSMAELTKSGHVYIISNVGSFGERMFKIGLTRRLDPFERVKELGDASVPFRFDVHAMIYSKDAPALEQKLHKHFAKRQVNLVNDRKEFFHASVEEIESVVRAVDGKVEFVAAPEAKEYRETLALKKAGRT